MRSEGHCQAAYKHRPDFSGKPRYIRATWTIPVHMDASDLSGVSAGAREAGRPNTLGTAKGCDSMTGLGSAGPHFIADLAGS